MTPRTGSPVPRLGPARRFGPLVAIIVAIGLVAVLASTGHDKQDLAAGGTGDTANATAEAKVAERDPNLPITYQEAKKDGTLAKRNFGPDCDPKTGRIKMPTLYAPPCVAAPPGVKGGATFQGVTATTITIVLYQPADQDLAAVLQAKLDPQSKVQKTELAFLDMFQHTFNTWGRKIVIKRIKGSGVDETSARADAVKVDEELHAFASLGGPSQAPAYADELASRHVLCINCGLGVPDSTYQTNAPYMWGPFQTPEQFILNLGDYVVNRLLHRKAAHAGDPAFRSRERSFGVVHFEQDPPVFGGVDKLVAAQGKKRGFVPRTEITYQLQLDKLGEEARTIVAKLKAERVTTVIFLGDPIMPINLTKAATEQNYFPEWIITGTVLTDTTTLGRLYDQKQWSHAFGISSIPVTTGQKNAEGWRLHRWYFGTDPVARLTAPLIYQGIQQFMLGVHMAGPKLTPDTFRGGMFRYPPSGGGPTSGRVSYGNRKVFDAPQLGFPAKPDYLGVDDMTEIWWDAKTHASDEQGVP
ncbi:MAG: ABC transporter substrate-binding protein, partial [Actinomycetota bacterium]|nr:ABC transporter substrate-binding protein [Actinomycetota bacterium]